MRKLSLKELNRVDVETFQQQQKSQIVLILDNVRSALNVGSAFRTADAFALKHIYLCGITATPPHREILKTAIGATESVSWSYHKKVTDAIQLVRENNYQVWGVEQVTTATMLQDFTIDQGNAYALVFGNEVKGISNEILPLLDGCLEVPQFGTKHSLNVSVCVGIIVWDLFAKQHYY